MARRMVAFVLVAGFCTGALAGPPDMSLADYLAVKRQLSMEHRAERAGCRAKPSRMHEVCLAEAIGRDWIAKRDLEVAYRSTPRSRFEAQAARADARFWLARAHCDDVRRPGRIGCLQEAKAVHVAALAEAGARQKTEELDDVCADEVTKGGWFRSQACVLRAAEVRKQRRRPAP